MKELLSYYKVQQLIHLDHETASDPKSLKNQLKNIDVDVAKMIGPTVHPLTPFNYEPYVRKSGPFAMYYEPLLADHLKIPDTNYIT